ncbi:MAG TPA: DUF4167 domain-containing protein [Sphingomicrobium sp.]|nr:DUF4167 domain-containing protein [Sphingomicrobium sp.]
MINNRQGGRRRGRGGQRGPNLGGNRQDNRQRGNATQLLEKYKNMARDAQLSGDRVQGEYFLQFAEHYFRMLGDNRPRFDDQRKQRGDDSQDEDDNQGEDEAVEASEEDRSEKTPKRARGNGRDHPVRNGADKGGADKAKADASDRDEEDRRIALEALPPSIGRDSDDVSKEAPKPRRRARKPRSSDDDTDMAPAA